MRGRKPDQTVNLGSKPGQPQLVAVIGDVIEPFAVRAGVVVPDLLRPRPFLAVDPETQGGTPVIEGTRVPYDAVAGLMRDGVPAERIGDYYPSVMEELEEAEGQRLVRIASIEPRDRFRMIDPRRESPSPYWPR